ncbi:MULTISPECIES: hypothetical protein [Arthrobacter]|uniref:Stage II sporulation protein M n=1 Tax=Arthrobacter terricola TaxID=2547396 RepID=A0A4V2ZTZ6_9MICC|nr:MULTISPECIES: hypothetical protein [Arthrobacter]MBT8159928.1 hypothetical protein [Arthrobacter sp. GN70]TDF98994.1 hypothetical protein E1809_05270 [Arthrobacter terricola]
MAFLSSHFPCLCHDFLRILAALAGGVGLASLFTWGGSSEVGAISAARILLHNATLALLALFLTHYGAVAMMMLNGFWLGMGLVASTAAVGLHTTFSLTVVHVPLEIAAWAMTIQGARLFWPTFLATVRKERSWLHLVQKMGAVLAPATIFYILAALAEWAEHALAER